MVQIVNGVPVYTVRIKFSKVGSLQYISHLDLVRTMSKIVVRTDLPLWYTEGFNPKPKMAFAAPLSIGTESKCELMDLRLTERVNEEDIKARFNRNMTAEMQVSDVYYPESSFTDLKWLSYTALIKTRGVCEELARMCNDALNAETVEIVKKTKRGEALTDLRPMIKSASVVADGDELRVSCLLSADPSAYLNPEYVIKVLKEKCGVLSDPDLTNEWYSIMRENAYREDMSAFV